LYPLPLVQVLVLVLVPAVLVLVPAVQVLAHARLLLHALLLLLGHHQQVPRAP
jgi:hypothetical protein